MSTPKDIALTQGLARLDEIAKTLHDVWRKLKAGKGFKFGKDRDSEARTHPHMAEWNEKPLPEQTQDRFLALRAMGAFNANPAISRDEMAVAIHGALRQFYEALSVPIPEWLRTDKLTPEAELERTSQADAILPSLRAWSTTPASTTSGVQMQNS